MGARVEANERQTAPLELREQRAEPIGVLVINGNWQHEGSPAVGASP